MHGNGKYKWKDGRIYEGNSIIKLGEYVMDKKEGHGVYTWSDGRKYDGMWKNGRQHGDGVYYEPNKKLRKGIWENGKRVKWIDGSIEDSYQPKIDDSD